MWEGGAGEGAGGAGEGWLVVAYSLAGLLVLYVLLNNMNIKR